MNHRKFIVAILLCQLAACGGGSNWEDDCRAKGGQVVDTPTNDHQCMNQKPLPVQDGRQGG